MRCFIKRNFMDRHVPMAFFQKYNYSRSHSISVDCRSQYNPRIQQIMGASVIHYSLH
uniref:Uncharacterized protein n=1 Tax=Arundo donax TaxID=35708 RepID=A0A0A9FK63_ARUDO